MHHLTNSQNRRKTWCINKTAIDKLNIPHVCILHRSTSAGRRHGGNSIQESVLGDMILNRT